MLFDVNKFTTDVCVKDITVEVVDSIMGSSKTTNICKWMDNLHLEDDTKRFFYISPLLDEVRKDESKEVYGRIHNQVKHVVFDAPQDEYGKSKSDHLLELLKLGKNIACTHKLYLNMSEAHFYEMKKHNYILVIDEEIGMMEGYSAYSKSDLDTLIDLGCVAKREEDGMLVWNKEHDGFNNRDHRYYDFKRSVENGMIYACKASNTMMVSQLPINLLAVANRVIIMTYMFEGNILSSFLKLKGIKYIPFTDIDLTPVSKEDIKSLVKLHIPKQYNKWKFMDDLPLSYTWYSGKTIDSNRRITKEDITNITKYIRSVKLAAKVDWKEVLYTFPKCRTVFDDDKRLTKINPEDIKSVDVLKEKATWLSSNTRATNEYSYKTCLIHVYNRYPTQSVKRYLQDYDVDIDDNVFAISEMLQWIWRSCIRDKKEIVLAIGSKRMRLLFLNWLHDLPLDNTNQSYFSNYLNRCKK